jgi:hypothetical protein
LPLAGSLRPAAALGRLWWLPSGLEACSDLVRLVDIFVSGAPEDQAAGDSPDGDGNIEFSGAPENPVLQGAGARPVGDGRADGRAGEGLNLLAERLVEHWLHTGSADHGAGFLHGYVFKCDRRELLGHGLCLLCYASSSAKSGLIAS